MYPENEMQGPVTWCEEGVPYSERFEDIYHSVSGAVRQADHVFLKGCGLPSGWQHQGSFVILETGFGLGLNFLTTCQRWLEDPKRSQQLHFVSVEAYPVAIEDIEKALGSFPELQMAGNELLKAYPNLISATKMGVRSVKWHFPQVKGHITLSLLLGDARLILPKLKLSADAIFMDGFSPAKNPELWGEDVCRQLARLSHPGTRLATWCVAATVREQLKMAGFLIQKVPGLPPKKNALTGVLNQ